MNYNTSLLQRLNNSQLAERRRDLSTRTDDGQRLEYPWRASSRLARLFAH